MPLQVTDEELLAELFRRNGIGRGIPRQRQDDDPPKQPTTRRKPRKNDLVPRWGRESAQWVVEEQSDLVTNIGAWSMIIIVFLLGVAFLIGDGYATIQGFRMCLAIIGIEVQTAGIPSTPWWTIPGAFTVIEIFSKRNAGIRLLWRPIIFFDGLTTAFYISIFQINALAFFGYAWNESVTMIIVFGLVAASIGLSIAILAEQIFLTSLAMLKAGITGKV